MGTAPCSFFLPFLQKRDNFYYLLFASLLEDKNFPQMGSILKGKSLLPKGSKLFPLRVDPINKGSKKKTVELLPLKVYPFTIMFTNKVTEKIWSGMWLREHYLPCSLVSVPYIELTMLSGLKTNKTSTDIHTCHTSHCEIKSHRIQPI